jgi:Holliday junction resolvase
VDILAIKGSEALLIEVKATGGNKATVYEKQVKLLCLTAEEIQAKTALDPKKFIAVKFRNKGWYVLPFLNNYIVCSELKIKEGEVKLMSSSELKEYFTNKEGDL